MKIFLAALLVSLTVTSCYKDSGPKRNAVEMLPFYEWDISKQWASISNYTNLYPTVTIVFGLDGLVQARTLDRSSNTYVILQTGTWTSVKSNGELLLTITFPTPTNFGELSKTWIATKQKEGVAILRGRNNSTDSLMIVHSH